MAETQIKTRILILSDTHGMDFDASYKPSQSADVVVHCGDLTDGSKLEEYRKTIAMLKSIDAPLKLAIAGNHDFTLDIPAFEKKIADAVPALEPDLVTKFYGAHGEAEQMFDQATEDAAIVLLEEGSHSFTLQNGALLTVYASPYTPSLGAWGFQYRPEHGHVFDIPKGIDLAITHGPPRGIMDHTHGRERAGCPDLFAATAHARPRVHCFGHVHEGWGAKLVAWKDAPPAPTHFSAIDNADSVLIDRLADLKPSRFESEQDVSRRLERLDRHRRDRCCVTSHCAGDERPLRHGQDTLFVNAALVDEEGALTQRPWLVDIELPRVGVEKATSKKRGRSSDLETVGAPSRGTSPKKVCRR